MLLSSLSQCFSSGTADMLSWGSVFMERYKQQLKEYNIIIFSIWNAQHCLSLADTRLAHHRFTCLSPNDINILLGIYSRENKSDNTQK